MVDSLFGPRVHPDDYLLLYEGYRIPFVTARNRGDTPDGIWTVTVDERIQFDVFRDEIDRWAPVLAWLGAVAAGYNKPGTGSTLSNPFAVQVSDIGGDQPEEDQGEDTWEQDRR